jgi:hypothetical protein
MRNKFVAGIAGIFLILAGLSAPVQAASGSVPIPTHTAVKNAKTARSGLVGSVYYYWETGTATPPTGTDGIVVGMDVANPQFNTVHDYHTLAEIDATDSSAGAQRVEFGWMKDNSGLCPTTTSPCLFVYRTDNHTPIGYNTAGGFIKCNGTNGCAVPTVGIGQTVPTGSAKTFRLQRGGGAWPTGQWWASFDGQWVGYWNDTAWTGGGPSFGRAYQVDAWGEVASAQKYPTASPCSAMGNGTKGSVTTPTPARVGNLAYVNNTVDTPAWASLTTATSAGVSSTPYYDIAVLGTAGTGFKYGGDNSSC